MLKLNLTRIFSGQTRAGVSTLGLPTLGPEVHLSLSLSLSLSIYIYIHIHIYIYIYLCVCMCVSILA